MKLGLLREVADNERRVALVPEAVGRLIKAGHQVVVQSGAGDRAYLSDEEYRAVGAEIGEDPASVIGQVEVLFQIRAVGLEDPELLNLLKPGMVIIALFQPLVEKTQYFEALAAKRVTAFSMDAIPRISRAQSMDVLSSMSTIAGYRAAVMGAERLGKFFPLLMTAAGTIPPARVLVLGAGVAGLQAIATARRLGALVQAFDTRAVVREQVESLGASFLTLSVETEQTKDGYAKALADDVHQRELDALSQPVAEADVVITTALVPGQRAPLLVTKEMVESMRPGSVIVDLAGESGGNCELSVPGETVKVHDVTIMAPFNVPSQLPLHASQLYARNLVTFFEHATSQGVSVNTDAGTTEADFSDEIVQRTCLIRNGEFIHDGLKRRLAAERG
ncbi:Re/Si-specific NAD(P)(+) transhydrogenase subunit alpha [Alicyclobacillus tolerans]|uniref:Re/Si-specific NAD(P)(+) transhydrogenase subunit alpha n=1 Tax=Alicyclobacillus tolerans TaxID=90970 RepID=UPI001F007DBD|nr:Re/Si-specific NAD(P)(+) transhydrogenase subunit alpha [Alicyclobacillus tolerans]MCF8563126.1 Re/Si-specific NAD(P)(+) transhydrogenase subunit alpha [Alicyclobacillus tolerans]